MKRQSPLLRVIAGGVIAVAAVTAGLGPGDVVLVKASRGLALDTVADDILSAVAPSAREAPG